MALGDFLARLGGGRAEPEDDQAERAPAPPTRQDLLVALDATEDLVDGSAVPSPVTARVLRVTAAVRDTIPRLDALGAGSARAYSVMATATDYLPEAVNGYLRLPRRFADTRPVDAGKTSLMVIVDQLDLLGATMDRVFDAVCRDDATALVAHGRFLAQKFGTASGGGALELRAGETSVPEQPADAPAPGADPGEDTTAGEPEPDPAGRPESEQAGPAPDPACSKPDEPDEPTHGESEPGEPDPPDAREESQAPRLAPPPGRDP